jgi:hypothetical protein
LQLATLQAWRSDGPLPEVLFVVARNKYPDLYLNLARTDAVRLYAAVVIANACESGSTLTNEGSLVVVPRREGQVLAGETVNIEGTFLKNISVYEISLHAIRARSRGKPDKDYLAVPNSAKRE